MGFPRKFLRQMFDKGGILTIGVLSLMMCKKFKLPDLMGTLAYGVTAVGAYGFVKYFIMDFDTPTTDLKFEKFLNELEKVKTVLEEKERSQEELRSACERFMNMRAVLEGLNLDMERIEENMVVLNLLQKSLKNSELSSGVNTTGAVKQSDNVSESSTDNSEDNVPESCIDLSEDNVPESCIDLSEDDNTPESCIDLSEDDNTPELCIDLSEDDITPELCIDLSEDDNTPESRIDLSEDDNTPQSYVDISEDNTIDQGHVLPSQIEIVPQKENENLLDEKMPTPHEEKSGSSREMDESLKMIEELQEAANEPLLEKQQIFGIDSQFEEVEKQCEEETERPLKDETPIELDTVVEKEYEML